VTAPPPERRWLTVFAELDDLADRVRRLEALVAALRARHVGPYTLDDAEADTQAARDGLNPKR
jgi:hypothetical protein